MHEDITYESIRVFYATADADEEGVILREKGTVESEYDDEFNDEFNDITIDSPLENMAVYQELMSRGLNGDLSFLHGYFSERDIF